MTIMSPPKPVRRRSPVPDAEMEVGPGLYRAAFSAFLLFVVFAMVFQYFFVALAPEASPEPAPAPKKRAGVQKMLIVAGTILAGPLIGPHVGTAFAVLTSQAVAPALASVPIAAAPFSGVLAGLAQGVVFVCKIPVRAPLKMTLGALALSRGGFAARAVARVGPALSRVGPTLSRVGRAIA